MLMFRHVIISIMPIISATLMPFAMLLLRASHCGYAVYVIRFFRALRAIDAVLIFMLIRRLMRAVVFTPTLIDAATMPRDDTPDTP